MRIVYLPSTSAVYSYHVLLAGHRDRAHCVPSVRDACSATQTHRGEPPGVMS